MRQLIVFILTALLIFTFTNPMFYEQATKRFPSAYNTNSSPKLMTSAVLAIMLSAIITITTRLI